MPSQFTREANRFLLAMSPRRIRSSSFHSFPAAFALLMALCVCVPLSAHAQDQQTPPAAAPASTPDTSAPDAAAPQTTETAAPQATDAATPATDTTSQDSSSSQPIDRQTYASRRLQTKQRREAQVITNTYTHRWDVYAGGSYMRFRPGPNIHNSGVAGWTLGVTRYFTPRFGITADARGYYGTNSLGAVNGGGFNTYNASFSVFPFTIGPQYRFYGSPKWSISGVVQGGTVYGYFDANTNGIPPQLVGFYPAGITAGGIASVDIDYNLSPGLAVRFAPHVLFDHFGGNFDHNQGFLAGLVYRFGRQ